MIIDALQSLAVPLSDLKPMPGNPRRGDVAAVKRSYERFGQRKPIVAKRDGTVIAGNHQLMAAQQLKWPEIAVVYVDDDDLTAKAFALADNRTGDLGTYDDDALTALLEEVSVDPDLLASTGYSLDDLLASTGSVTDTASEPNGSLLAIASVSISDPITDVSSGDIWMLDDRHYLFVENVFLGHQAWLPVLAKHPDAIFLPYPEPMITCTVRAETTTFVMVQPSKYLAGHLLDRHIAAFGPTSAVKL